MKKHNKILRIFGRIFFHAMKVPVVFISFLSHRLYMRLYAPLLRMYGMQLSGHPRYISRNCYFDSFPHVSLGDRVVISTNVSFLTHDYSITTALIAIGENPETDYASDRNIVVGNNVFIGRGSIIMPNTTIGDNVIIGAGSVVRGKIPSDSIVTGNPAEVSGDIKRFAEHWKGKLDSSDVRKD